MKDFILRNKIILIVLAATFVLVVGGVLLLGKPTNSTQSTNINSSVLVPEGVYQTTGFVDGKYLAASASAKITLVEFGDYVCPACGTYEPIIKKLLSDHAGKINYVFRNYPLSYHTNAIPASYAVEAAGLQGKYWEMHEKIFTTQNEWSSLSDPVGVFVEYARDLGLDIDKFSSDMNSQTIKDKVQRDYNDGNTVGLTETPTFYINGVKAELTGDPDRLENLIRADLNQ